MLFKQHILEKNRDTHPELSADDSILILENGLYNPTLIAHNQPNRRAYYWFTVKLEDKSAAVVIHVYPHKDDMEVVGWRYIDEKGIDKLQRQAEREGGQFLILAPEGSAAALSALPFNLSVNKDTTVSAV